MEAVAFSVLLLSATFSNYLLWMFQGISPSKEGFDFALLRKSHNEGHNIGVLRILTFKAEDDLVGLA